MSHDQAQPNASEGGCRPTLYMSAELLAAIEAQCEVEGGRKRSPFVAEILELLLTSDLGQHLQTSAQAQQRSLLSELQANLILFNSHIPTDRIVELAEKSQRYPDQMLVRLVLLGLQLYEPAVALIEAKIEGGQIGER
ncbi:hypothetical protein IQ273_30870 [Nodosilinea sp. LEGE 07298]|uniref:hypothetical protein n=1 Tax=Nodosilinea sp. LEGE 07298 TaxID=2777970 RepID=UPI00187DF730|nr:hypothetical protein [Nodosilinea sp. LEGE 07298]MBE9113777.1 hypothetical protein [Nodosilinea sp. LEGE 07298]